MDANITGLNTFNRSKAELANWFR